MMLNKSKDALLAMCKNNKMQIIILCCALFVLLVLPFSFFLLFKLFTI